MGETIQEEQILNDLKAGSEPAFDQLFNEYYKYLVYIAFQYLKEDGLAKDVVQEVFLDLWRRREELDIKISVKAYLRRAVINKGLNVIRKNERISYPEEPNFDTKDDKGNVDAIFEYKELEDIIKDCVDELPERCRQIFKLSREKGLSHKEIAAELEISTKTIEAQMTKALKRISAALKKYGVVPIFILYIVGEFLHNWYL